MTVFQIRYGGAYRALELPDEPGRIDIRRVAGVGKPLDLDEVHRGAERDLRDEDGPGAATRGKAVALLLPDATRQVDHVRIAQTLARGLRGAARLTFGIATGTHDVRSPDNEALARRLEQVARSEPGDVRVHVHDCGALHVDRGKTRRGTPVAIDPVIDAHDAFVVASDVKPHYFAGYSNPAKYLVPGFAAFETVRANHSLALDAASTFGRHPWHADPTRRAQPLAEDLVEAYERVVAGRPAFAWVTVTDGDAYLHSEVGPIPAVSSRAFAAADRITAHHVEPADIVVVSCGGYPGDESLYTAQRALELTRAAFAPGATVFFLAECRNGIGPSRSREHFFERLKRSNDEILTRTGEPYRLYSHKAVNLARMRRHVEEIRLTSMLDDEDVRSIGLVPEPDPAGSLRRRMTERPDARVLIFDDANKLAVYATP